MDESGAEREAQDLPFLYLKKLFFPIEKQKNIKENGKQKRDIKNMYVENWNPFRTSAKVHSCLSLPAICERT